MSTSSHSGAVMITGATGGLGRSLARRLARERDFDKIVLAVRNAESGTALRDRLQSEFPGVGFAVSQMDLASLASVRAAAAQLEEPLAAIVLNAGGTGGPQPRARTMDGVSQMFAANVVGHAALVDVLLSSGLLRGTVEFVGSEAAFGVPALRLPAPTIADGSVAEFSSWIDGSWFDGRRYDRGLAHGQTKLLGALWIGALARSHPGLRTVAMSPGNTSGTGVLRDLPLPLRVLIPRINGLLGRSHSLDVGTEHLASGLLDPGYGTGRFWASAPGKMTGPAVDQAAAHPIVEDPRVQDHASAALRAFYDRALTTQKER
jgi:NAD(P)-dependent dehydrogenase (short-subunit alcohol dehydrogenase family)